MDAGIKATVEQWLEGNYDQATKDEIKRLQEENPNELTESFYRNLEFGTGGLRGIMGVGTNRINKYTIGMATQGYAYYLKASFPGKDVRVAIAHDSRKQQPFFCGDDGQCVRCQRNKSFSLPVSAPDPGAELCHPAFALSGGGRLYGFA